MIFYPHQKDITDLTPRLNMNGIEIERVETFDFFGATQSGHKINLILGDNQ